MLLRTSGVKFLRTVSNMAGVKGLPDSTTATLFLKVELLGASNSDMNSENAAKVGDSSWQNMNNHDQTTNIENRIKSIERNMKASNLWNILKLYSLEKLHKRRAGE